MLNDKILEFYSELREEVQDYVKNNGPISVNAAFKTLFLSYCQKESDIPFHKCFPPCFSIFEYSNLYISKISDQISKDNILF